MHHKPIILRLECNDDGNYVQCKLNKYASLTFVGNRRGRHVGLLVLVLDDDLDLPPDEGRIFAGHWHPFLVVGLGGGRRRRRNLRRLGVGLCSLGHVGAVRTAEGAGEGAVGVEHIYADLKLCTNLLTLPSRLGAERREATTRVAARKFR